MKYVILIALVAILGKANADLRQDILQGADDLIRNVEIKLEEKLHALKTRDIKDDLLKRAEVLLKRSHEAVEILEEQNRKHEAEHIEREQAELEKLVAKLKEANQHQNIRHLEHEIDNLEHRIQTELDRLNLKPHHDHREELLKRAEQLIKHADEAIKILENQNQTAEVQTVKADEENLKKLAEQLKTADKSHLHELEKEVAAAEAKLGHDLGKIYEEVKKAVILKGCEKLEADVDVEIKKLEASGHEAYTKGLAEHKQQLEQLVSQLRTTTEHHAAEHLEKEIIHLGTYILKELKLVERDIALMKHLMERSEAILIRVDALVPELNTHNLTDAAHILQAERAELVLITNEVKNETSIFALTYLEDKLNHLESSLAKKIIQLEKKLMEEMKSINPDVSLTSQELVERAAILLSKVREAIEKLKSEGKGTLAAVLEKAEKTLLFIDQKVSKIIHPTSETGKKELQLLETLLNKAEKAIEAELKKLNLQ